MQGRKQDPHSAKASHADGSQGGADPEAELKDLRRQVEKLTEIAARAQADLQNARARSERDAADLRTFATESVLRRLLPTIDNFQRSFQHLPDSLKDHAWVKGMQATEQELLRHLAELGLKKVSPIGKKVDPLRHEVLLTGPGAVDTVVDVLEDGYELHGKVLRPAKVKAGTGEAAPVRPQDGTFAG